ncbi:MAG: hypothetical protein KDD44_01080 [Bdellovibrionales bacterium]|nr:hypothetical protein [Bdellovibrionales bacterium]
MPYIPKSHRPQYEEHLKQLADIVPDDRGIRPGHMNYIITSLLRRVYGDKMRYADHNEVMGVLSAVSQEFYRRWTAPYEDEKIAAEGDVR